MQQIPPFRHDHSMFRLIDAGRGGGQRPGARDKHAILDRDSQRPLGLERYPCTSRRRRADHARAVAVARQIASEERPSFITNYIEAEAHALLLRKLGRTIAREWLLRGGLPMVRVLPAEEQRAKDRSLMGSSDLPAPLQ